MPNPSLIPTLKRDPSITVPIPTNPVIPNSRPTYYHLPRPSRMRSLLGFPRPSQSTCHIPSPSIQLHVQLDVAIDASSPTAPRVVVVNPTPGPSPPTPPTTPVLGPAMGGGGVAHDKGTVNGNGNEARRFTDKLLMPLPMPMPIFGIQVAPSSPLPISNSSGSSSGRTVVSSSLISRKVAAARYHPLQNQMLHHHLLLPLPPSQPRDLDSNVFLLSKGGEKHLSPERASGPCPSMRTAARPDHIWRTSSAGRSTNEKKTHSSKSTSRSRS
jgi:hypothetical protein